MVVVEDVLVFYKLFRLLGTCFTEWGYLTKMEELMKAFWSW